MSWMDMLNEMDESEVGGEFGPIPDGWYEVVSSDAEEKQNKSNSGHHVAITLEIIDGDHKGRKVWARWNIDNPNPVAQKIGLGEMKRFMMACGMEKLGSVDDLNDKTLWIKIGRDKRDAERDDIKAYKAQPPKAGKAKEPESDEPEKKPASKKAWQKS